MLGVLFLACFLTVTMEFGLQKNVPKFIVSKSFSTCSDSEQLPIVFKTSGKLSSNPYLYNTDYEVDVKEDINHPLAVELRIDRCKSKEAPGTCAPFQNFKSSLLCNALKSKHEFWSPFIGGCLKPKFECPLKKCVKFKFRFCCKNLYEGKNCTLDLGKFNWLPIDCSYWKMEMVYIDNVSKNRLSCTGFEGSIC